ncbi:MAG: flagellar assembly peptidoglycan hydrolase FlgJ [Pseudomonadota bacterium]
MISAAAIAPDRLAVDVADAQALRAKAASGDRAALVGAAKQFEAMLVSQMLKNMRQTRFNDEDDPLTGGEGMKLYQDLLDKQWADQISKGRGLGFADMMVKALERQSPVGSPQAAEESQQPALGSGPSAAGVGEATTPGAQLPTASSDLKTGFIARMAPHAEAAAAATGVPAAFILGHAALESGWGRHEIKDSQGRASHNLFGIKAGSSWDGAVAETVTTEYRQGVPMKLVQSFRAYSDYSSAFTDYANLLKGRYGQALQAGEDASAFAQGLAAGGYATDPAYAGKLQSVIASVGKHLALAGS